MSTKSREPPWFALVTGQDGNRESLVRTAKDVTSTMSCCTHRGLGNGHPVGREQSLSSTMPKQHDGRFMMCVRW